MKVPTETGSGRLAVHGAFAVAAAVGVLLVLISSFMAIVATRP